MNITATPANPEELTITLSLNEAKLLMTDIILARKVDKESLIITMMALPMMFRSRNSANIFISKMDSRDTNQQKWYPTDVLMKRLAEHLRDNIQESSSPEATTVPPSTGTHPA